MNAMLPHPVMPDEAPRPGPTPFTADDFVAILCRGGFAYLDGKVELDDGNLIRMNSANYPHYNLARKLNAAISRHLEAIGSPWLAGQEASVRLSDSAVREPDVCVHHDPGDLETIMDAGHVLLAIEVSDWTLAYDLGRKMRDYALAGIAEYWVADVEASVLHVHTGPSGEGYAERRVVRFGEAFESLALGVFTVAA